MRIQAAGGDSPRLFTKGLYVRRRWKTSTSPEEYKSFGDGDEEVSRLKKTCAIGRIVRHLSQAAQLRSLVMATSRIAPRLSMSLPRLALSRRPRLAPKIVHFPNEVPASLAQPFGRPVPREGVDAFDFPPEHSATPVIDEAEFWGRDATERSAAFGRRIIRRRPARLTHGPERCDHAHCTPCHLGLFLSPLARLALIHGLATLLAPEQPVPRRFETRLGLRLLGFPPFRLPLRAFHPSNCGRSGRLCGAPYDRRWFHSSLRIPPHDGACRSTDNEGKEYGSNGVAQNHGNTSGRKDAHRLIAGVRLCETQFSG